MRGKIIPYNDRRAHSDAEWLGSLPAHWTVTRAKNFLRESDERSATGDEEQLSVSHLTGVTPRSEKNVTMFEAESYVGHKMCRPDDLVINTMWAWMGALGVSSTAGVVSPSYGVYRLRHGAPVASGYLDALLRTPVYIAEYVRRSTGIHSSRLRLYSDEFLRMPLIVPPLEEQTQIAKFLDYETAKIDALIEKQQQLIALLKEKRQAVISHAVTKGLNPDAPMRDSGVEWLGKVPKHWVVCQLKRTWASSDYGISESTLQEGAYEVLTMGEIQDGEISLPGVRFVRSVDPHLLLAPGDLLFNRTNSLALVGKVGLFRSGQKVTFASYCVRLRLNSSHDSEYFNFLLNSDYVLTSARASSFPSISQTNLNPTRYGCLPVAFPSLREQREIAEYLVRVVGQLDAAAKKAMIAIDLLQERRAALISAAVTGKIDVRGWKPPASAPATP